jgi:hypothetical protein
VGVYVGHSICSCLLVGMMFGVKVGSVGDVSVLVLKFASGYIIGLSLPVHSVPLFGSVRCVGICLIQIKLFVRPTCVGVGSKLERYVVVVVNNVKDLSRLGLLRC